MIDLENEEISDKESTNLQKYAYQKHKLSVKRLTGIFIMLDIVLLIFVIIEIVRYIEQIGN
jgi:hypothetical protein